MEISVNFVFFEELQDEHGEGDVARIVVVRQSENSNLSLDEDATAFFPVD